MNIFNLKLHLKHMSKEVNSHQKKVFEEGNILIIQTYIMKKMIKTVMESFLMTMKALKENSRPLNPIAICIITENLNKTLIKSHMSKAIVEKSWNISTVLLI
jgi:hypothetical protein